MVKINFLYYQQETMVQQVAMLDYIRGSVNQE